MQRSKVVILESLGDTMDISSLESFGEIATMFDIRGTRCPSVFHTDEFMDVIGNWFEDNFDPEHDYFVVAGRATKIAFALLAFFQQFERGRTLIYDGSVRGYVERKI